VKHFASALSVTLVAATLASAQITVDGTAEAGYGAALFTQNTDTGFGNNLDPDPRHSTAGSEIDQVFGRVDGGFLYLMFAGNLESQGGLGSFNKLEIFIDSEAGGVNVLDGANLPTAVDGFCCTLPTQNLPDPTSGALQRLNGLTFDAGFTADHFLTVSSGVESNVGGAAGVSGWIATTHYAQLNAGSAGTTAALGGVLDPFGDELDASLVSRGFTPGTLIDQNNNLFGGVGDIALHEFFEPVSGLFDPDNENNHRNMDNTLGVLMGVNQTNIAGVNGSGGPDFSNTGDPQNVTTGFEFAIPLAAIGNPTGDIKVTAFVAGNAHDFLSNQVTGGFEPDPDPLSLTFGQVLVGNLADPSTVNFSALAGNQFVTITQGVTLLAGDFDGNGFVGIDDLNILLANWNTTVTAGDLTVGDADGTGFIGVDDLNILLANWNAGTLPTPPGTVIPEPASLALLGLGGIAMLRRRR